MFACLFLTVAAIVQRALMLISRVVEARGVTMCRLASSIVKYASVIGILYWCLALLGVDTATLLASAGLLTFAVSLGAKDIVTDIISGLFIIFEGEFRVGDIIQVGGQRGTVMEIDVRTTKINDGSGNVLVLRNSNISNVVNMTKEHSYAAVEVGIEYGESLERVESILAKELPNIKKRLPAIVEGPFYKGVTMLADNSVNIKIVAECVEKDRLPLINGLNKQRDEASVRPLRHFDSVPAGRGQPADRLQEGDLRREDGGRQVQRGAEGGDPEHGRRGRGLRRVQRLRPPLASLPELAHGPLHGFGQQV